MKLLRPVVLIAAAVAVVLLAHHYIRRSEPPRRSRGGETPVVAEVVAARGFADRTEAIGTAMADESVLITPAVTERVTDILFEDGERVAAGDTLVELEHDEEAGAEICNQASATALGLTTEAIKRAYIRAVCRAGIENLRFHDLRHEATPRP